MLRILKGFKKHEPDAYTIITNPGEDASRKMRISWHTDLRVRGSYVIFTEKTDYSWQKAMKIIGEFEVVKLWKGLTTNLKDGRKGVIQKIIVHNYNAELIDLKPNTEYMYRVGKRNLSPIHYFKTAGTVEFSFAWISDYHYYDPSPNRLTSVVGMINKLESIRNIDFILSTGDDVAYGGSYSYWKNLFRSEPFLKYMWVTTNGNHDNMDRTNSKNTKEYFRITHNNPLNGYLNEEGVSYWFIYGNVLWIVLNTEDLTIPDQVEIAKNWAKEVIESNRTKYIFFVQHYQWFHGKNGLANSAGFTRWSEFFDEYGVDIAFAANDHIYLRSLPIYKGEVSKAKTGTVYLQANSSDGERGLPMNEVLTSNEKLIAFRYTENANTITGSLVTVGENHITITLYNRNGEKLDFAEIPAKEKNEHKR